MECLLFTFSIFERCKKKKKRENKKGDTVTTTQHLWKRDLLFKKRKTCSVIKTYEGLTVNAKLPEHLFSFRFYR